MAFKKGETTNPVGRPKGSVNKRTELMNALKRVEKKKRKTIWAHFIEEAYKDRGVLIALMKKLVPDMKFIEGDIGLVIKAVELIFKDADENQS